MPEPIRQELPIAADADPPVSTYPTLLMPQAVHARLSAHCNLDCAFCERVSWSTGDKPQEEDMTEEVWERLVAAYLPHVLGVELVGLGEPTLAKLFPRAASDVVAAGKTLYFATNGLFLDKPHVLNSVGDTPRVSISVDAGDAVSYKEVRGGDWDRLDTAIRAFRAAKPGAFLHSQFTAGTYNIDYFPAFVEQASKWGINEVLFRWVQAHTVAREDVSLRWSKDRTEAALTAAWEVSQRTGINLIVERRPYSDSAPNGDAVQPASVDPTLFALHKYLDLQPFDSPTCDGDTGTGPDTGYGSDTRSSVVATTTDATVGTFAFGEPQVLSDSGDVGVVHVESIEELAQPRAYCGAALIVAGDGALWSCFAQHVVGNALTDSFDDVINRPRYQAFLQNRARGHDGILEEAWCANCARTF